MNNKEQQAREAQKELQKNKKRLKTYVHRRHIRISERNHTRLTNLKSEEGRTIRYWADVIFNQYFKQNTEYDTK